MPDKPLGNLAILVGGGPAPGINGVISAATIEGMNQGFRVLGVRDGYKWLAQGGTDHIVRLTINGVKDIHLMGGSILGTSRTNPTKSEASMRNVLSALEELGVSALVSIGGFRGSAQRPSFSIRIATGSYRSRSRC